jgi:hypothetical protein
VKAQRRLAIDDGRQHDIEAPQDRIDFDARGGDLLQGSAIIAFRNRIAVFHDLLQTGAELVTVVGPFPRQ